MTEATTSRVADAIKPDGFVDFYGLLAQPESAPAETLRARINALYSEAQANRDHRNISKRREYEMLLELLPFARTVLLDGDKRARYDAYASKAQSGSVDVDFETFMNGLTGKTDSEAEERASLLGVKENRPAAPVPATPASKTVASKPKAVKAAPAAPQSSAPSSSSGGALRMGAMIAIGVFVVLFGVLAFALKLAMPIALVAAAVAAGIAFFVANKPKGKIST